MIESISIGANLQKPKFSAAVASGAFTLYVPLEGKIDREAEVKRTEKELEKARNQTSQVKRQLGNAEFCKRKPELAEEARQKLETVKTKITELEAHLRDLAESA